MMMLVLMFKFLTNAR